MGTTTIEGDTARMTFSLDSAADYAAFLRVKSLPAYSIRGREARFPAEYLDAVAAGAAAPMPAGRDYEPIPGLWDYQAAISRLAIRRRKFAIFMECGLGKTLCMAEFARHAGRCWGRIARP